MNYALSIKQPWATLVVHGLKTIEVRRWSTERRGPVLIHAGRIPDRRAQAWPHVPAGLQSSAKLGGGIVGTARLVECRTYNSAEAFARDQRLHLNDPSWFQGPVMYGFVFAEARPVPFWRCSGSLYFFEVANCPPAAPRPATGLLVSVRNATEAVTAMDGGADLIDVKDPRRGSLGCASGTAINEVLHTVEGRRPVSAAFGELADLRGIPCAVGLAFVKCGLAHLGRGQRWQMQLASLRQQIGRQPQAPEVVTVAYADWKLAGAPPWPQVVNFALRDSGGVLLIDTFDKSPRSNGKPATLLDWLTMDEIQKVCAQCHAAKVRIALAGSLAMQHVLRLLDTRPTWFAVRRAVCEANKRDGEVHILKVRDLVELLRWHQRGDRLPKS